MSRLLNNLIATMSSVGLLLAIAAELPATIANTAQWITAREVASNAAVKQHGEAAALYEQSKTELEVARNAGERMKAEADQLSAEADKLESMAISAKAEADNASRKTKADADTMVARAALNGQKAKEELQKARVAALNARSEADSAEQSIKITRKALRTLVYQAGIMGCPGNTYFAKVNAYERGQCRSVDR